MAKRVIKPPAKLAPRDPGNPRERLISVNDGDYPYDLLRSLSCFKGVDIDRKGVELRTLPGAIILRYYRQDEVICHQDDPGYTAFYILKKDEIEQLPLPAPLKPAPSFFKDWNGKRVVSVRRRYYGRRAKQSEPVYMSEGEIFGEMSCLYRVPRTATVTAEHDCYVLEFMRNVFVLCKMADKVSTKVIQRILELQLRGFELFENLSPAAYDGIVQKIKQKLKLPLDDAEPTLDKKMADEFLQTRKHNELLFDEHDQPDGLYIIRLGLVKIVRNISALIGKETIKDWPRFYAGLVPSGGLWRELKFVGPDCDPWGSMPSILAQIETGAGENLTPAEAQLLLYAINGLLKRKDFHERIGFAFDAARPAHRALLAEWEKIKKIDVAKARYDDLLRLRLFNRRILELLLPEALHAYGITPPQTVAYRSSREWVFPTDDEGTAAAESSLIGEIGLFKGAPRSATCIVYCHPESNKTDTQLVAIDNEMFADLIKDVNQYAILDNTSATSLEKMERTIAERNKKNALRLGLSAWQESSNSARFDELGLIQGQKLMLIDLDRCTRCDKCVEACVESHSPHWWTGWLPFTNNTGPMDSRSRLFLDGPRIQMVEGDVVKNYLVPTTCRQCKDAVCLFSCPVGSIHKGDNGQIVIEDWCIGCTRCAENCPYNAIQMHTIGVVPASGFDWQYRVGAGEPVAGRTPFRVDPYFAGVLRAQQTIEFSRSFDMSAEQLKAPSFKLYAQCEVAGAEITAVVNDTKVNLYANDKNKQQCEALLVLAGSTAVDEGLTPVKLHKCGNRMTLHVHLPAGIDPPVIDQVLLDAGLVGHVKPKVDQETIEIGERIEKIQEVVACDANQRQDLLRHGCVKVAFPFSLSFDELTRHRSLLLDIQAGSKAVSAAVDQEAVALKSGQALLVPRDEQDARPNPSAPPPQKILTAGDHLLIVEVAVPTGQPAPRVGEPLLSVKLLIDLAEYQQDWVTQTAVVCDMCSGQFGRQPACVTACPHEAAERRYVTLR